MHAELKAVMNVHGLDWSQHVLEAHAHAECGLQVGKAHAAQVAKAPSKAEALRLRDAGFEAVQQLYSSRAVHVEELKSVAMALRRLPVVDPRFPTVLISMFQA